MNRDQLFGMVIGGVGCLVVSVFLHSDELFGYGFGCIFVPGIAQLRGAK
jgi:hypothetical protein